MQASDFIDFDKFIPAVLETLETCTQTQLAEAAGIKQNTISTLLERKTCSFEVACAICIVRGEFIQKYFREDRMTPAQKKVLRLLEAVSDNDFLNKNKTVFAMVFKDIELIEQLRNTSPDKPHKDLQIPKK
jgi:hypothetical protein